MYFGKWPVYAGYIHIMYVGFLKYKRLDKIGLFCFVERARDTRSARRVSLMALCNAWGIESPGESAAAPSGCPNDLWQEFQKLRKAQTTGRAKWWSQWELVLYKASDTRIGVVIEKGDIKLRHKQCGAEYGTENFSQTATKHSCDKV